MFATRGVSLKQHYDMRCKRLKREKASGQTNTEHLSQAWDALKKKHRARCFKLFLKKKSKSGQAQACASGVGLEGGRAG